MTRRILFAIAVAIGAFALVMPAVHAGLTVQAPTLVADDEEYWDEEEEWEDEEEWGDEGYYWDEGPDQAGPWANVCAGFDTGLGIFDIGNCTPNLIGP